MKKDLIKGLLTACYFEKMPKLETKEEQEKFNEKLEELCKIIIQWVENIK